MILKMIISTYLLLVLSTSCLGHAISKPESEIKDVNGEIYDIYEVNEGPDTIVKFVNPKSEKPTLREIIYYHIIEKPYDENTDTTQPTESEDSEEDETTKPFTNSHSGYQFLEDDQNEDIIEESETEAVMETKEDINTKHEMKPDIEEESRIVNEESNAEATEENLDLEKEKNEEKPIKRTRKLLYDLVKEKYSRNHVDKEPPLNRRKRELRMNIPEAPRLPDIDYDSLPAYLRTMLRPISQPKEVGLTADRITDDDKIRRNMYEPARIRDSNVHAEKSMPRTYGMYITGDDTVIWNDIFNRPRSELNLNMAGPEKSELQKEGENTDDKSRDNESMKSNTAMDFGKLRDFNENAEKPIPRTYGMHITGDSRVVWNDLVNEPVLQNDEEFKNLEEKVIEQEKDQENSEHNPIDNESIKDNNSGRLRDNIENAEKPIPRTYGMHISGDQTFIWNDFLSAPATQYDADIKDTEENVDSNITGYEGESTDNEHLEPELRKARNIEGSTQRLQGKTYGMDLSGNRGVVWNDFLGDSGVRYSFDTKEPEDTQETFVEWLTSWISFYMERMAENTKTQVQNEVKKVLDSYDKNRASNEKPNEKESNDVKKDLETIKDKDNITVSETETTNIKNDKLPEDDTNTPRVNDKEEKLKGDLTEGDISKNKNVKNKSTKDIDTSIIDAKNPNLRYYFDVNDNFDSINDDIYDFLKENAKMQNDVNSNILKDETPVSISGKTLIGSSAGNQRVTNIFIFNPNKETGDLEEGIKPTYVSEIGLDTDIIKFHENEKKINNNELLKDDSNKTTEEILTTSSTTPNNNELVPNITEKGLEELNKTVSEETKSTSDPIEKLDNESTNQSITKSTTENTRQEDKLEVEEEEKVKKEDETNDTSKDNDKPTDDIITEKGVEESNKTVSEETNKTVSEETKSTSNPIEKLDNESTNQSITKSTPENTRQEDKLEVEKEEKVKQEDETNDTSKDDKPTDDIIEKGVEESNKTVSEETNKTVSEETKSTSDPIEKLDNESTNLSITKSMTDNTRQEDKLEVEEEKRKEEDETNDTSKDNDKPTDDIKETDNLEKEPTEDAKEKHKEDNSDKLSEKSLNENEIADTTQE